METLVWTRGRDFPLSRLETRLGLSALLRVKKCGGDVSAADQCDRSTEFQFSNLSDGSELRTHGGNRSAVVFCCKYAPIRPSFGNLVDDALRGVSCDALVRSLC